MAADTERTASSPSRAERARWAFEDMLAMRDARLHAMGVREHLAMRLATQLGSESESVRDRDSERESCTLHTHSRMF